MLLYRSSLASESLRSTHLASRRYNYPCLLAEKGGRASGCNMYNWARQGAVAYSLRESNLQSNGVALRPSEAPCFSLQKGKAWPPAVVIWYSLNAGVCLSRKRSRMIMSHRSGCKFMMQKLL